MFPGTVDRRNGVTAAQRGPSDRQDEHEVRAGAQVSSSVGSQVGQLRAVHALRPLPRRPVSSRLRSAQSQPGKFVFGTVLNRYASREPLTRVRPAGHLLKSPSTAYYFAFYCNEYSNRGCSVPLPLLTDNDLYDLSNMIVVRTNAKVCTINPGTDSTNT